MGEFLDILKIAGPSAALFIFFVWRDYNREKTMSERISKIEDYQRDKLEKLVIAATSALEDAVETRQDLINCLNSRPCINGIMK